MSNADGTKLGDLIDRLKRSPQGNELHLSMPGYPQWSVQDVASYRGYYDQLALSPCQTDKPPKVSAVIDMLEGAVGKTYEGYKGGEFVMDLYTRVWIAEYGTSSGLRIYAVEDISNSLEDYTTLILIQDSYS